MVTRVNDKKPVSALVLARTAAVAAAAAAVAAAVVMHVAPRIVFAMLFGNWQMTNLMKSGEISTSCVHRNVDVYVSL